MRIIEVAFSGTVGTREMGPVSTDICELANGFAERGHEVVVADVVGDGSPRSMLHRAVRLLELPALSDTHALLGSAGRIRRQWLDWKNRRSYVRDLVAALEFSTTDIVHLHAARTAFLAEYYLKRPALVYTAHTPLWSLGATSESSLNSRLSGWIERRVIRGGRLSIGLGDYLGEALPGANVITIPNGIDVEAWPAIDRSRARQAIGIDARTFAIVFAARIHPSKGVDTLVEAIRQLAHALPGLRAYVIGPLSGSFDVRDDVVNPYSAKLLEQAKGLPVEFLGFINSRDARFRQYLAAADLFVLPSRAEAQGKVVLEALVMGTPVIGSATGGIPQMISKDVGYLFEPGNAVDLASRIREAHDDPAARAAMRAACRARVREHFTWDAIVDRHLNVFTHPLQAT